MVPALETAGRRVRPLIRALAGTPVNAVLSLMFGAAIAWAGIRVWRWAVADAAFGTTPESCRAVEGACWSVVADMWPLFLVGLYPLEERWRVALAAIVVVVAAAMLALPALRRPMPAALIAVATLLGVLGLLYGGEALGLPVVGPEKWGGLLLTLVLAVVGQTLAFPLGVLLALARTARDLPVIRVAAVCAIEAVRSLPLVLVLLLATLITPIFLPATLPLNTMVMAQIGFVVFSGAAFAEIVRGGLQGVPPAQVEAAAALGLRYWGTMGLIVLPQALRMVQPALVGSVVSFVKGSSLVVAIGLYDLLGSAMLAAANDRWVGHSIEPLITVGAVFWAICFTLSRISARWERERAMRMTGAR